MLHLIPYDLKIDFIGKRKIFITLSLFLTLASLVLLFTKGLNFGIDFRGGTSIQVLFNSQVDIGTLRTKLGDLGFKNISPVQLKTDKPGTSEYLINMEGYEAGQQENLAKLKDALTTSFGKDSYEVRKVEVVGPKVGKELKQSAVMATLYALLAILIYIWLRFDFRYSPGAVVSLAHDVIITLGILSVTQKEFTLTTLAAILTIVGYSINDTIVIYDRIREHVGKGTDEVLSHVANRAINQTLSRTILTVVTVLFICACLWAWAGGELEVFGFILTFGFSFGTYSSIFIATPCMLYTDQLLSKKASS